MFYRLSIFSLLACTLLPFFINAAALVPRETEESLPAAAVVIEIDSIGVLTAFDKDHHQLGRYNSTTHLKPAHHKRDGCTNLSPTGLRSISGWGTLLTWADTNYGRGWELHTNPPEYPSGPALSCVANKIFPVTITGNPQCSTFSVTIQGTVANTNGVSTITIESGYSSSSSYNVEQASELSFSGTVSATLGVPGVGEASVSATVGTTFTNTVGRGFTTQVDNKAIQSLAIDTVPGKRCFATLSTETCFAQCAGKIEFIASGWAWFFYPSGFRVGVLISAPVLVPDESQRNGFMTFNGGINGNSVGKFEGSCDV